MRVTVHRGTHEIGGSCVEVESGNSRIVLDLGIPLVDDGGGKLDRKSLDRLDGPALLEKGLLPGIRGVYQWDANTPPDGILLSHAHLDHYGFFRYVRPDMRFYLGEGTRRLIELTDVFVKTGCRIENHVCLKSGEAFAVGEFHITPYLMDHSAFDAYAFVIEASCKKLIYSGDFRSHGRKRKAFEWFLMKAPRHVDALLMEGSMIGREDAAPRSEKAVEDELTAVFRSSGGLALCLASGQNIDRLVTLYRATIRSGRILVLDLYTANVLHALSDLARIPHPSEAFPQVKVYHPYRLASMLKREGKEGFLYRFKNYKITKKEIGEAAARCVMLMRQSMVPDVERIGNLEGATLVYSMWGGYLKEASAAPLLHFVERTGLKMIHVHTSGHAGIPTLKRVVRELQPKAVVPIHTFMPDAYENLIPSVRIDRAADGVPFQV